jgi:uncharacterized protein DUF6894
MPRFYFDVRVNGTHGRDEEGQELPDLAAAESAAREAAMAITCDEFPELGGSGVVVVETRDQNRQLLLITTAIMSLHTAPGDRSR